MPKVKIEKEGEPCRHCKTPVFLKISKFREKKLKKKYYYTAYFKCPNCRAVYMSEQFKVLTTKETQDNYIQKPKQNNKLKKKKFKKIMVRNKEDYRIYLKSSWWRARKKEFWLKHRKICFCCNGIANQIHHRNYGNIGNEKDKDLVPICGKCHEYITDMVFRKEAKLKDAHIIYQKILLYEF